MRSDHLSDDLKQFERMMACLDAERHLLRAVRELVITEAARLGESARGRAMVNAFDHWRRLSQLATK